MSSRVNDALSRIEFELAAKGASYATLRRVPQTGPDETASRIKDHAGDPHPDLVAWFQWQNGARTHADGSTPPIFADTRTVGLDEYLAQDDSLRRWFDIEIGSLSPWVIIAQRQSNELLMHAQSGEIFRLQNREHIGKIDASLSELLDTWTEVMRNTLQWDDEHQSWREAEPKSPALIPDPELVRRAGY